MIVRVVGFIRKNKGGNVMSLGTWFKNERKDKDRVHIISGSTDPKYWEPTPKQEDTKWGIESLPPHFFTSKIYINRV